MGKELDEFERLLHEKIKGAIKAQIVWAKVVDVDWEAKEMTCESLVDGLEYYNVSLGLGAIQQKPKKGTLCRLGIMENKDAAAFLIEVQEFEECVIKSENSVFIIKEEGFIVKQGKQSLKEILNDFIDEVNKIIVVQGTTINVAAVTAIKQRLDTVLIE